jgi:hypothetical protein
VALRQIFRFISHLIIRNKHTKTNVTNTDPKPKPVSLEQENSSKPVSNKNGQKRREVVEVIVDGKTYRLVQDEKGEVRCDRNIRKDVLDRVVSKMNFLIGTGLESARVVISTANAVEDLFKYYDNIGNELYKEAIPKLVQERANAIIANYLSQASQSGGLDPRLLEKAYQALRGAAQNQGNGIHEGNNCRFS